MHSIKTIPTSNFKAETPKPSTQSHMLSMVVGESLLWVGTQPKTVTEPKKQALLQSLAGQVLSFPPGEKTCEKRWFFQSFFCFSLVG